MQYQTCTRQLEADAAKKLAITTIVDTLTKFADGEDVTLDFLSRAKVGQFCATLGIRRNWAELDLDKLAPVAEEEGVNVVPEDEAIIALSAMQLLLDEGVIEPEADGKKNPQLLNDFLPEGEEFKGEKCLGHLWEWRYAMAVELEHGTTRGTNVTSNHPLLTGMVVAAHLSEDRLYYARLWVMETEGSVFNMQLEGKGGKDLLTAQRHLNLARKHLEARIAEKLDEKVG